MILIQHGATIIKCDTPEEAERIIAYLKKEDKKEASKSPLVRAMESMIGPTVHTVNPWTFKRFFDFIEALGDPQKETVRLLVTKHRMTDEQLRKALKVANNQQLAGILSGISKQAASLGMAARDVFTIENESKAGEVTKTYVAANRFLETAKECNWPDE